MIKITVGYVKENNTYKRLIRDVDQHYTGLFPDIIY